ncbi:hypothetical protein SAMN05444156_1707 [Verrucomicrobium sp. GAS474]|uniref:hypothetical protein n=1 Tax=Verrucomicrobium sp. GAS474 TaxID=1882831 RepID=UPI00087DAC0A|nr:hypothetical protein [Verrucomicrobium sp. GAS474]SDU05670.1 hypothetical protein SAMN05444156_1707 [Verrucomicrobium sp. GAS474]
MNLDLRLPIGILFTTLGLILSGYGWATHGNAMYARSLGININIEWGAVLIGFGGLMLFLALRKKS